MLLSLLLAALTETTAAADRRASAHEVARRLGVPWRREAPPAVAIPRTRIELWAWAMRRLWTLHPEDIPPRKTALVALFTRLHAGTGRVGWMKKRALSSDAPTAEADLLWVDDVAGSEDLRAVFFAVPPPGKPTNLASLQQFPLWFGEAIFYQTRSPLSAFPAYEPEKARLFYHIARALTEHAGPTGRAGIEQAGPTGDAIAGMQQWTTRMTEIVDWAEALHPDLSRMTWDEITAAATAMHQALTETNATDWAFGGPIPDAWILASGPDGWTLQRLVTKADFAAEGTSMAHCIGGPIRRELGRPNGESEYYQKSRDQRAIYLSVRQAGVPLATIELTGEPGSWRLEQVQGPKDGDIESGAAAALVHGLEVLGVLERQDEGPANPQFSLSAEEDAFRKVHRGLGNLPLDQIGARRAWAQAMDWYATSVILRDLEQENIRVDEIVHEVKQGYPREYDSLTQGLAREVRTFAMRLSGLLGGRGSEAGTDWVAPSGSDTDGPLASITIRRPDLRLRIAIGLNEEENALVFPWVRRMAASGEVLQEIKAPDSLFEAFVTLSNRTPTPDPSWVFRADQVPHPDLLETWTEKNGVSSVDSWAAPTPVALAALGKAR